MAGRLAAGVMSVLLVSGCGGGGSGGSPAPSPTPTPAPTPTPTPTPTPDASSPQVTFAMQMAPGWNLGNSLDAVRNDGQPHGTSQETWWGNPAVSQELMNGVAAAGFKSVRIPVTWHQYADNSDTIPPFWLARVKQVVDMARNAGLYVILNQHHESWLQPTFANQAAANARMTRFWTQIANHFKDYDQNLLFAGTNEVHVGDFWGAPTPENCTVQNGFNQKFVEAVRATGGNNATRYLVVQGYVTNIDFTIGCNKTMPEDPASDRLMIEVHYYDPFNFALNDDPANTIWQWGSIATDPLVTETWANEAYADAQFNKMKVEFVDRGIPVILGEYGAILRTEHDAAGKYRTYWDEYITRSAYQRKLVPVYWDNGYLSNHQFGLFNRNTGAQGYPATIKAIVDAAK